LGSVFAVTLLSGDGDRISETWSENFELDAKPMKKIHSLML
jgi:hypothetical protein